MPIFFFIAFAVLLTGVLYCGFRLIPRTSLRGKWKVLVWLLIASPLLMVPLRIYVRSVAVNTVPPFWVDVLIFASYLCLGMLSALFTVLFAYDIFLVARWLWRKMLPPKATPKTQALENTSRRIFMQNSISAGLTGVAAGMVGFGAYEALHLPETKEVTVPIANLPKNFHNFTIVQLSDLHINRPLPPSRMEKIVEKVNGYNPDAIVITGDLSDSYVKDVQDYTEPLRKLNAKEGKFFVTGNHEYYTNVDQWLAEVARLDLTNLHNEHKVIERQGQRLLMCGVPDLQCPNFTGEPSDPILAQADSTAQDIKVLLAHQPQSIYDAVKVDYHLQISGHTHGGQFFPWNYVIDLVQPYVHGLYKVENTYLYVSRGTGFWGPPVRIGAPSEITLFTLIPA